MDWSIGDERSHMFLQRSQLVRSEPDRFGGGCECLPQTLRPTHEQVNTAHLSRISHFSIRCKWLSRNKLFPGPRRGADVYVDANNMSHGFLWTQ